VTTSVWGTWTLDPVILLPLIAGGLAYAAGVRSLWSVGSGHRGVGSWRVAAFAGGWVATAAALVSPLHHAGTMLLSAHMGQHLVLIVVAAPLLVLGRPGLVVLSSLSPAGRRLAHRMSSRWTVRAAGAIVAAPLVAWFVHVGVVWAWHVPGVYQAALDHPAVHALEHASFLGTAMLFWWVALEPGARRRLAKGADVLYLLAAWVAGGALGALLTFAPTPIYPAYVVHAASLGVDPLKDQQVAGLVMWIPGGLVYLGGACVLFVSWLRGIERAGRLADATGEAPSVAVEA
jgi:putative membrane protein